MRKQVYKLVDEITGQIITSDHVKTDWDGSIRHEDNCDGMHPDYLEKRYPEPLEPALIAFPGTAAVYGPTMVTATTLTAYGTCLYYQVSTGSAGTDSFMPPRQRG